MSKGWITTNLGNVANIYSGATPSTTNPSYWGDAVAWITPDDLSKLKTRYISRGERSLSKEGYDSITAPMLPAGSILISSRAPIGYVALAGDEVCTNQGFKSLVLKTGHSPHFFYYLAKLLKPAFEAKAGITTFKEISASNMARIKVTIPSNHEQQEKIAKQLSVLDSKIEHNNELIQMLEEQAQLVYDYWFMQFDFPDENGKPYRSSGGKMKWSDELKREIPEGWNIASLSSYLADTSTGDWGKDEPTGNYTRRVYCIRGADIMSVEDLPVRYILEKNSHKFLRPNDMVIEVSGGSPVQATGRSTFISAATLNRYDCPVICTNFCQVLRQKDDAYARYFYRMWNRFYDAGVMFNYEGKTSGIKNLLVGAFCTIKWYFPPRKIAVQYNELVDALTARLEYIKQVQKALTAQRDFLLPRLMTGEITVAE